MKEIWRTEVLTGIKTEHIRPWRDRILQLGEVHVNKSSRMGMNKMIETEKGAKSLMTECTVTVDGQDGFGFFIGTDTDRAEIMALLEALFKHQEEKWKPLQEEIDLWLEEWSILQDFKEDRRFRFIRKSLDQ
ncbi:MAG TPA: hypothetical protein DDY49_02250 [Paenibacillaceae bacterium]|nr:hypothetical protein [Paenibacillaceae bacterium]